jgi:hypothetical protein
MLRTVYGPSRVMRQPNRGTHAHVQASEHAHWAETVIRARVKTPGRAAAGRNKRQVLQILASHLATGSLRATLITCATNLVDKIPLREISSIGVSGTTPES